MDELGAFLPALGAFLVVVGGGGAWIWGKLEARMDKQQAEELAARVELKGYLEAQIAALKDALADKQREHNDLLRHVIELEAIMVRASLEVPPRPKGGPRA